MFGNDMDPDDCTCEECEADRAGQTVKQQAAELTRLRERCEAAEAIASGRLKLLTEAGERLAAVERENAELRTRSENVYAAKEHFIRLEAEARARCVALERSKERWKGVARVRRLNLLDAETYRAIAADDRDAARQGLETALGLLRRDEIQWPHDSGWGDSCVVCGFDKPRHEETCELAAFLAAHPVKPSGT